MKPSNRMIPAVLLAASVIMLSASGCETHWQRARRIFQLPPPPLTLGTQSDEIWQKQETNAEASDFVIYQHEFQMNGHRLNTGGEDHVKQIAARLHGDQDFPVIIERSMTSVRENTKNKYPVHPNPELDMKRREVVVRALTAMEVADADERVLVAPALATGYKATEAQRAYQRGLRGGRGFGFGGFGGLGGGFGGGLGGFGGFGGGF